MSTDKLWSSLRAAFELDAPGEPKKPIVSGFKVGFYFPNRDAHDEEIKVEPYIISCMDLLLEAAGGVTRSAAGRGLWFSSVIKKVIKEDTVIVYSFIMEAEKFLEKVDDLVAFIVQYGEETGQDSIMMELAGEETEGGLYRSRAWFVPTRLGATARSRDA